MNHRLVILKNENVVRLSQLPGFIEVKEFKVYLIEKTIGNRIYLKGISGAVHLHYFRDATPVEVALWRIKFSIC